MKEEKLNLKEQGITLIALVVTIIILLILAGVAISIALRENGLFQQARQAAEKQTQVEEKEQITLACSAVEMDNYAKGKEAEGITKDKLEAELRKNNDKVKVSEKGEDITVTFPSGNVYTVKKDSTITGPTRDITIAEAKKKDKFETKTNVKTEDNKVVPVPAEFKIAEDSATKVEEGVVIEDAREGLTKGSQFVWIPVESAADYVRNRDYPADDWFFSYCQSNDVEGNETVINAGGFYISRFEAGKEESNGSYTLVSKKEATVWNNIDRYDNNNCYQEAEKFIKNDNVFSELISGIQWDVVMKFVDGKPDGQEQPSLFNVTEINDSRHTGVPAKSGANPADKVCNIYDLEGNYKEMTSEYGYQNSYIDDLPFFLRGGCYITQDMDTEQVIPLYCSAAYNTSDLRGSEKRVYYSFRFVLYVL